MSRLYDLAACKDAADPGWFDETSYTPLARSVIRDFCHQCPVMSECYVQIGAAFGFTGIAGGILWGGRGPIKRGRRP